MSLRQRIVLCLLCLLPAWVPAAEPASSGDVEALRQEVAALRAAVRELQAALGARAALVGAAASVPAPTPSPATATASSGAAPARAQPAPAEAGTARLFGYGELNYNRYLHDVSQSQADLRRFVVGVSYAFSDRLRLESEIEWEHAVTSATDHGESEIEQAWINYSLSPQMNLKAGLFLMPFGFLNTSHEPPAFRGVERNEVETRIIPSTWREGGLAVYGDTASGWAYETGVTTSFSVGKFDDPGAPLRAIHQELQLARAANLAFYGALNFRGVPGLTLGGALFSGNSGQANGTLRSGAGGPDLGGISARVTLGEAHLRWQPSRWDLQALFARGQIGEAAALDARLQAFNQANAVSQPMVPAAFQGWYAQAAYRAVERGDLALWPFLRFEYYNTQAAVPAGVTLDPANASHVLSAGLTLRLHPQVVIKADYQRNVENRSRDRLDLGLGYQF